MADADDPRKTMIYKFLGSGFSAGKGICSRIDLFEISKMSPGVVKWVPFFFWEIIIKQAANLWVILGKQFPIGNNGIFW